MGLFRRRSEDALATARREAGLEDDPEIGSTQPIGSTPEPAAAPPTPVPAPPQPDSQGPARTIAEEIERASRELEPSRGGRVGPAGPVPTRRR
jgi:hypothetical protein